MEKLFEESKQQLNNPLRDARRKLIIILNLCYTVLVSYYLISEKVTTGKFVPHAYLYFIYLFPLFINIVSLTYNLKLFFYKKHEVRMVKGRLNTFINTNYEKIDPFMGWLSITFIMLVNFCNLIGLGNPSNDAIFADYILSCSLITGAVIIIGRPGALLWTFIVVSTLFWDVSRLGWNYEYHYLTPNEAAHYKEALRNNDPDALQRKTELEKNGLNPPKVTRYFNAWLIYIVISLMAAYYFSGIAIDILKIIPSVVSNIEKGIGENQRIKSELEQKEKESQTAWLRVNRYSKIMKELNEEFEKLDFEGKKSLMNVITVMRNAVEEEANLEISDSVHDVFLKVIKERFLDLTKEEVQHLMYLKMNLPNPQIATLLGVSIGSLRTMRYKLKKKMNLNTLDEIIEIPE